MKRNPELSISVSARVSTGMAAEIERILIDERTRTLTTTGRRSEVNTGTIVREALIHYLPLRANLK